MMSGMPSEKRRLRDRKSPNFTAHQTDRETMMFRIYWIVALISSHRYRQTLPVRKGEHTVLFAACGSCACPH
jgi:hypothetical protein